MHLQSARDVYYRFTLHYKKENLVVERNLGDFLFLIQTINKQNMSIKGKVLDVVSNFRSYCEGVDVNSSTCDIMQKELNEKYKSFK